MSSSRLLEADPSILESNLRIIKDEEPDDLLSAVMKGDVSAIKKEVDKNLDYRIITPTAGICIKVLTVDDKRKVFINLCQSDAVPPPEPITADRLMELLRKETEHSYRIPMSISELRQHDLKGTPTTVCDVVIHPDYLAKVRAEELFSDFLVQVIIEAIDAKYNIQLDGGQCVFLKNRQQLGTLVKHRIQKRDIKTVYDSYNNPDETTKSLLTELDNRVGGKKRCLIEELPASESTPKPAPNDTDWYRLVLADDRKRLLAEFHLPQVLDARDFTLDVNEDRIVLRVLKTKQSFDEFLPFSIDVDQTATDWDPKDKILIVTMELKGMNKS